MAYRESYAGKINRKLNKKLHVVEVASGRQKADLVLKNATYVNVFCNELSHGDIAVAEGLIAGMGEHYEGAVEIDMGGKLVLPGFVDAHIHLESALVSPKEFANAVIPHGTTTVITDPHEIANVMGTDGIEYMLQATEDLPVDVRFMLPSCVPATPLDESGAVLDYRAIDSFYEHNRVEGLAEMMNYVGVANADEQVLEKIVAAQAHHKKIDGHAPGLSGNDLNAYIAAGVYSDHECSTVEDAIAKLERGQYIMIREGTAARNLDALLPLLTPQYYTYCMFCTDDKHPNDLLEKGHIQNPTAYDNNKCNSNNTFRCFLRHLAFGTDGIGIESQGIIDLMRGTHGGSVCDYRHALIHNGNRDLEFRIRSLLIDREIFFTVNDHVVIIRTAPLDIGSYFAVFHSDQSR